MESFEITFFCTKKEYKKGSVTIFHNTLEKYNSFDKDCLIEIFDGKGTDFIEIRLSIFDLVITSDNFHEILTELSGYTCSIFKKMDYISFATGVYQLTYYLIEDKKSIAEFDISFLEKFPILFFKPGQNYNIGEIVFENECIVCVYNENAQDLY